MHTLSSEVKQYLVVTGTYWAFTITDGALRMLVVLYFHQLGYSPLEIASLFLLYEFFGLVTNLVGGWLGAHIGLNKTMHLGVVLQLLALLMLTVDPVYLSVAYVMAAQALSGIAKDLNKMSAKSSIKLLLPNENQQWGLYKWVAVLTGSKNALKGAGFFIGAALLGALGFRYALFAMAIALLIVLLVSLALLKEDLGKTKYKPKFSQLFSKSRDINSLSAARLFLFGSRDVWFVVALPVYFQQALGWAHYTVGTFMAAWIIAYGLVQSLAPTITGTKKAHVPNGKDALVWSMALGLVPLAIGISLANTHNGFLDAELILVVGLLLFGGLFAVNSSVHSFLILAYSRSEGVSLDVGFYYMANALGRLIGTVISGAAYQRYGLEVCLFISSAFIFLTTLISFSLPKDSGVR